jgi:outer membrane protein assembly factor BamB
MNAGWVSFLVLSLSLFSVAGAADWPQWRGPQRNGISPETGLLKEWPQQGPKLLWQLNDIGDGYATPAVVGNRIFLLSNRGLENEFVQALSVQEGKPLWTTRLGNVGNPDMQPSYPKARSTPAVDGDRLYALGSDGDLVCLEAATGKVLWRKSLRADFGGQPGTWAYAESPLIDGDVLVVTPGGKEATIVALNKKTGDVIWKSAVPGGDRAAYASAIVAEAAGRKQYMQFLDQGVVGVDARTGRFLWRYDQTSKGPANIASPVARDGYVYSTNARRFGAALVQLHASGEGVGAEQVYFERDLPNTLGGQVLVGRYIYGTNPKGPACAEFTTGKLQWQHDGLGPGAVLYADGHLYFHGENGDMLLVEATPAAYREKGRFTLPGQPKRASPGGTRNEQAWAYPVLADGRLYVRDLSSLWCYDVRDPKAAR